MGRSSCRTRGPGWANGCPRVFRLTPSSVIPNCFLRYNLIAIWGCLGGLAVGLWVVAGRQALPARVHLGRAAAIGLVVFAGLAHAQANADLIGEDWVFPALALPRLLAPLSWAWPLAVLAVALFLDWRVLKPHRTDPAVTSLRVGDDGNEFSNLIRLSMQRPLVSLPTVWSFVRTRRVLLFTLARDAGTRGRRRIGRPASPASHVGPGGTADATASARRQRPLGRGRSSQEDGTASPVGGLASISPRMVDRRSIDVGRACSDRVLRGRHQPGRL